MMKLTQFSRSVNRHYTEWILAGMEKIHQVIIRNIHEKGLDVVATNLQKSQIQNISLFLPEEEFSEF